jgi:hypothetical protein
MDSVVRDTNLAVRDIGRTVRDIVKMSGARCIDGFSDSLRKNSL